MTKSTATKKPTKSPHEIPNRVELSRGRKHMVDIIIGAIEKDRALTEVVRQYCVDFAVHMEKLDARLQMVEQQQSKQTEQARPITQRLDNLEEMLGTTARLANEGRLKAERREMRAMGYIDCLLDQTPPVRVSVPTGETHAAYGPGGEWQNDHIGWREVFANLERERGPKNEDE